MRVIAARSRGWAGRMGMAGMDQTTDADDGRIARPWSAVRLRRANATAPRLIAGAPEFQSPCGRSATVAEEAQQEQEQVDEVEIERERAHHRLAAHDSAVLHRVIHLLDPLGVPGGQ